jgi:hypothetical protein
MGHDCSIGTATRYGLDGPGIESRWGRDFSAPVQNGPGAHPASYIYNEHRIIPEGKAAGAWR